MKYILLLIISGALVVSGFGQTRNVLVGTNNAVVQPTNFWSADASNARTALGLGTAATNAATAFQPSSLALSNLASSNGVNLTNISVSGIVGALATNGNAANLTNFPANLLRTNGSAAGLTNFPASLLTTNGNGSGLTSLNAANINGTVALASNVSGVVAITNGGTGATNAETARTNLGLGWSALTNSNPATALLGYDTTNGQIVAATNVVWTNSFSFSTNTVAAQVRSNLGLVGTGENSTIGGGRDNTASTNYATVSGGFDNTASGNYATVVGGANNAASGNYSLAAGFYAYATNARSFVWAGNEFPTPFGSTNNDSFNVRAVGGMSLDLGTNGIVFRNTTNASVTRTNLGLGWSALTNTNAATALLGYNASNNVVVFAPTNTNAPLTMTNNLFFESGKLLVFSNATGPTIGVLGGPNILNINNGSTAIEVRTNDVRFSAPITFQSSVGFVYEGQTRTNLLLRLPALTNTNNANFRTDIELGWSALTNTNSAGFQAALFGSNTNPVLVNTSGTVVSPTNFWQQAPIATTVAFSAPTTNSTNTATNSRNLILQSLALSITGVVNTIVLPTNTSTFNGDTAVVIHAGGSGSATAIRQSGQTSNLIVLTNFDHAVRFLYFNNTWDFYHNLAYVEPIYFSGTNAAALAAASRTNLGLGATNDVTFGSVVANGAEVSVFAEANIGNLNAAESLFGLTNRTTIDESGISFSTNTIAATTRTNLGIPLAALTNTNNANLQAAVFATNTAPTNAANFADRAAWMEITVSTNGTNHSFRIPLYK